MRTKTIIMAAQVLLVAVLASACFSFRGGDETIIQQKPSTDRELQDLKAAYDKGAISEQEYNQQRQRLLQGG